jgi:queuine/archaeosine tRNA-ribosyltransferase
VQAEDVKSGVIVTKAIAAVDFALAAIGNKATPEEITEFKQFIYACAQAVASAAGSGLFGSGDPKVSPEEAAALTKIKAALNI